MFTVHMLLFTSFPVVDASLYFPDFFLVPFLGKGTCLNRLSMIKLYRISLQHTLVVVVKLGKKDKEGEG